MAPLVPYIIGEEFNLIIALLIGIAFGFVLEQAGFSSTKKLVGLFYGYDFTVLRVFFTAGVTAMVGVLVLGHLGLLDLSIIYINPMFTRSALVGGFIMGAGFLIGGFCPGTSVCAAAIGKLDAMAFIVGSIIGIFAFTEGYPLFDEFYLADATGPVLMFEKLGMSRLLFGFVLTAIAIGAFYATWLIENKVNKREKKIAKPLLRQYVLAALIPIFFLTVIAITPNKMERIEHNIAKAKEQKKCTFRMIEADQLAYEIVNNHYEYNIIDVRVPEEFNVYHLPLAINIPFDDILDRQWEGIFKQTLKTNVFYADNDTLVKMSCLKAKYIGKSTNLILNKTATDFRHMFYQPEAPLVGASKQLHNEYNFRVSSAVQMDNLVEALKNIGQPVKKEIKAVKGGCS